MSTRATRTSPSTSPSAAKLREPAVRFGNLMRTFHATAASGRYSFWTLGDPLYGVNQQPLSSPTVFNFYSPDFSPQGAVGANGLTGPWT
ncbi:MAG: hypothetical protein IPI73_23880 [Betaproteobacteria bacterium]|nr:hypothetical protein [Betaproteobacteria bacterium]